MIRAEARIATADRGSNMFGSKPECPIDPQSREWIERRWGWLVEQFGANRARSAMVVLPTPAHFPDEYARTKESLRRLFVRVCGYMGIDPAAVELSVFEDCNPVHDGLGRLGTTSHYGAEGSGSRVWIEAKILDDPLALVAALARELANVHLLGSRRVAADAEDLKPLADLTTVFFGLGVITGNAVIRESSWHAGAVSSWSMSRQGFMSMPMFGYALAKLAELRSEELPNWAREMRPDVRTAFDAARRFLAAGGGAERGKPSTEIEAPKLDLALERDSSFEERDGDDGGIIVASSADQAVPDADILLKNFNRRDRVGLPDIADFIGRMVAKVAVAGLGGLVGAIVGLLVGGMLGMMFGKTGWADIAALLTIILCVLAGGIFALWQVTGRR
jgi:hypothetical protein